MYGNRYATDGGSIIRIKTVIRNDTRWTVLRLREDDSNTHLEWLNAVDTANSDDGEWETLLPSLTTGKIPLIEVYNSYISGTTPTDTNQTIISNGEENFSVWNMAFGTVASNDATTLTLNAVTGYADLTALGFDATGTIIVDGTEYAYTGLSTLTFTGLSGLPTFTANTGVAQAVFDSGTLRTVDVSTVAKIDTGIVADGRLWGARSDASCNLVASKAGEAIDFSVGSGNPGDGLLKAFVEGQSPTLALASKDEKIFILGRNHISFYELQYPDSTSRVEVSKTFRQGPDIGIASKLALAKVENDIWFTTARGQIKSIFKVDQDNFDMLDVAEDIRPTVENFDFSKCSNIYFPNKRIFLSACRSSSDMTFNDKVIVVYKTKDENKNIVQSIDIKDWHFNDFTVTPDGDLIGASSVSSNVFKLFDGWSIDGAPYQSLRTFKRLNYGLYFNEKEQSYIPIVGGLVPGTTLHFDFDYDSGGSRGHIEATLVYTDTDYLTEPAYNTIGSLEIGAEPIGGPLEGIADYQPFIMFFSLPREYSFFDLQLTIWSDGTGQRWYVDAVGLPSSTGSEDAISVVEELNSKYYKSIL